MAGNLILLVVLLIAGLPITFVLGVTAATMILLDPAVVRQIIGLIPLGGANNYLLVAALLFMIAGEVMNQGRFAKQPIAFASRLVGHIRSGLAHVNILTSRFFSEISGTATSDAAAIGSVMIPQMTKRGYPAAFAAAITSTSAMMATLMLVPIFLPLADQLGIDRVHFGLILTINLGIGQQTPPVALVVLVTCAIAKISIAKIIPSMLWFIGAMLVALILVNMFPAIVLWLPSVIL
jgi:TRAP-type C4-dicarboxylate transport system permease large subunit